MSIEYPRKKKKNLLKAAALGLNLIMPVPEAHALQQNHVPNIESQQEQELGDFLDKKRAELQTNPKFRDGFNILREWVNESGLECREYLTPVISRSGAWIVKTVACQDPNNKHMMPIGEAKLVEVIEQWGPGTFDSDMVEKYKKYKH